MTMKRENSRSRRRSLRRRALLLGVSTLLAISAATERLGAQSFDKVDDILAHCSGPQGPDEYCRGYITGVVDILGDYNLWLSMNKYDFPAGDGVFCLPLPLKVEDAVAALSVHAARNRRRLRLPAKAVLPAALAEAFPCAPPPNPSADKE
jgi:hypothetical protein